MLQKEFQLMDKRRRNQLSQRKSREKKSEEQKAALRTKNTERTRLKRLSCRAQPQTPVKTKKNRSKFACRLFGKVTGALGKKSPLTKQKVAKTLSEKLLTHPEVSGTGGPVPEDVQVRTGIWKALFVIKMEKMSRNYRVMKVLKEDLLQKYNCNQSGLAQLAGVKKTFINQLFRIRQKKKKVAPSGDLSKRRTKLTEDDKQSIQKFYRRSGITMELPHKREHGKTFMCRTIRDAYLKYTSLCIRDDYLPVSFSSFSRNRPDGTRLQRQVPDLTCGCLPCMNCGKLAEFLICHGVKGLSKSSTVNICNSLCQPSEDKTELSSMYPFDQLCIRRKCKHCGVFLLQDSMQALSTDIDWQKEVTFSYWVNMKKEVVTSDNKKEMKGVLQHPELCDTLGNVRSLFLKMTQDMAVHRFNMEWQSDQFENQRKKLRTGEVLMVCDFGTNFSVKEWEEPHSKFWNRGTVTVFNVVVYYRCPQSTCHHLVSDEIVVTSDDTKHDFCSVKAFTEHILRHLEKQNVPVTRLIRYADNCAGQFKSLRVNFTLSKQRIPTIHNYFCANHGKSAADGVGGRCMQALGRAIKTCSADVKDAQSIADYMTGEYGMEGKRRPFNGRERSSRHVTPDDKALIRDFFLSSEISLRREEVHFLKQSQKATYELFLEKLKERGQTKIISQRTFLRLKPLNVVCTALAPAPLPSPPGPVTQESQDLSLVEAGDCQSSNTVTVTACREKESLLLEKEDATLSEPGGPSDDNDNMCCHHQRHFFCINDIDREVDTSAARTICGTQTIHCFRNTGKEGFVEVRENTCCCDFCCYGEGESCPNDRWVSKFQRVNISEENSGISRHFEGSMWNDSSVDLEICKWKTLPQKKTKEKHLPEDDEESPVKIPQKTAPSIPSEKKPLRISDVHRSKLKNEVVSDEPGSDSSHSDMDYDYFQEALAERRESKRLRSKRRRGKRQNPASNQLNDSLEMTNEAGAGKLALMTNDDKCLPSPNPCMEREGFEVSPASESPIADITSALDNKEPSQTPSETMDAVDVKVEEGPGSLQEVVIVGWEGPTDSDLELVLACQEEEKIPSWSEVSSEISSRGISNNFKRENRSRCSWDYRALRNAPSWRDKLKILGEERRLERLPVPNSMLTFLQPDCPDHISQYLLQNHCKANIFDPFDITKELKALCIYGNDRCLYNSFSRLLYGDDSQSDMVTVTLMRHLVQNENLFLTQSFWEPGVTTEGTLPKDLVYRYLAGHDVEALPCDLEGQRKIFRRIISNMTSPGETGWGGVLQLAAFANVSGHPIRLIQPHRKTENSVKDPKTVDLYNRWFLPFGSTWKWKARPLFLMHTLMENSGGLNHFICLIKRDLPEEMEGAHFEGRRNGTTMTNEGEAFEGQSQDRAGPKKMPGNAMTNQGPPIWMTNKSDPWDGKEGPPKETVGSVKEPPAESPTKEPDTDTSSSPTQDSITFQGSSELTAHGSEPKGERKVEVLTSEWESDDNGSVPVKRKWDSDVFTDDCSVDQEESDNENLLVKRRKWADQKRIKQMVKIQCVGWVRYFGASLQMFFLLFTEL